MLEEKIDRIVIQLYCTVLPRLQHHAVIGEIRRIDESFYTNSLLFLRVKRLINAWLKHDLAQTLIHTYSDVGKISPPHILVWSQ